MSEQPQIPVFDVQLDEEDIEAVVDVLRSGWLTMGPRTEEFEKRFAEYLGCEHVVATSSCTAALHLALLCAGVGPGDEVIVPAITFVATANAVRYCGATPVFAEIVGDGDLSIDAADVEARITDRTRAVLPVHFGGYPAAIESLAELCRDRGLALVEDAAQSPGSRVAGRSLGTFGLAGCFSFFSNKPLGVGEGGAVATDSEEVAARARSLRSHAMTAGTWDRHRGHAETYDVVDLGFNYRIDEQRAAVLSVRLGGLDGNIRRRRELIARYRVELASVDGLEVAYADADPDTSSGYLMLALLDDPDSRAELRARLREEHGVQTTVFPAVHRFTAYGGEESAPLPRTEAAAKAHLVLPLFPHMSEDQQDAVVAALREELRRP
jgi:dTDP-4-amino-4,6-dideoxygalactose transaminase